MVVDPAGNVYFSGHSRAVWKGPDGREPLLPGGALKNDNNWGFGFVVKLSADGVYLWHTWYGSPGGEVVRGLWSDDAGNLTVLFGAGFSFNGPGGELLLNDPPQGAEDIYAPPAH